MIYATPCNVRYSLEQLEITQVTIGQRNDYEWKMSENQVKHVAASHLIWLKSRQPKMAY